MDITWDKDEAEGTTEASDIGWPAGHWPSTFIESGRTYVKYSITRDMDNDIIEVKYRGPNGRVIRVFND